MSWSPSVWISKADTDVSTAFGLSYNALVVEWWPKYCVLRATRCHRALPLGRPKAFYTPRQKRAEWFGIGTRTDQHLALVLEDFPLPSGYKKIIQNQLLTFDDRTLSR
jgi:hypothetical protein